MDKKYKDILKKTTLLLVDDNKPLRTKFKNILYTYVGTLHEASNGEEAVDIFNKVKPNIVITDFKMPVMDGLELTTFIRRVNKNVPIVIISAYTDKDALIEFTSLNLVQYLVKPINFEQLNATLLKCAKQLVDYGLVEVKISDNAFYSFSQKAILKNSTRIPLSPNEIKFLELLLINKKKLVSIEAIEYELYDNNDVGASALNNLVSKLRKKIGTSVLINIPKIGYIFIYQEK